MEKFCYLVVDTLENREVGCFDDMGVAEHHIIKLSSHYLGKLLKKELGILNEMKTADSLYVENFIDQKNVVDQLQRQIDKLENTRGTIEYKSQLVHRYKIYTLPADFKTYKAYPLGLQYRRNWFPSELKIEI